MKLQHISKKVVSGIKPIVTGLMILSLTSACKSPSSTNQASQADTPQGSKLLSDYVKKPLDSAKRLSRSVEKRQEKMDTVNSDEE